MARNLIETNVVSRLFPTRALIVLLAIGFIDLVVTAVLHAKGLIVEVNPLMRFFIERGEWLFAAVKGATLVIGWIFLARYAKTHRLFVRNACLMGSFAYVAVWVTWFCAA